MTNRLIFQPDLSHRASGGHLAERREPGSGLQSRRAGHRLLRPLRQIAGCTLLALLLAAAQAPPTPDDDQDAIIVTGTALTEEQARDRATAFVRSTGVAQGETPAARWIAPVCPKVLGITEASARSAEALMRAIAVQARMKVAGEPCEANVIVSFTADPVEVLRQVDERAPRRLGEVPLQAREALMTGDAPIRWWYSTEELGRHGQRARNIPHPLTQGDSGVGAGPGGSVIPDVPTMMHYENSTISTLANRAITSASVVIDQRALVGIPLEAVAAYAALVGFAEIRDASAKPEGSILGLFGSPGAPRELTAQDRAFLRALYRIQLDRQAIRHRGSLVREMTAALAREE